MWTVLQGFIWKVMCGVNYGGAYSSSLILIFGSLLFPKNFGTGPQRFTGKRVYFSNNLVELSVFYSIFILLFESPRQLNKGCCVPPHLGVGKNYRSGPFRSRAARPPSSRGEPWENIVPHFVMVNSLD